MKAIYVAGKLIGVIVERQKNTLLIRKAFKTYLDDKEITALTGEAMYVDAKVLEEVDPRIVEVENDLIEPINIERRVDFVREFVNV
ncbi:hypothetical protein [Leuconostoc mesenteroides]|uniref:hypothetical protein n=1 Tax=Leuconostoc mesenteroides TaxID=1245 RepID=UPI0023613FBC|nr:hypothetical protein [Leuconostoc mesenteroides]